MLSDRDVSATVTTWATLGAAVVGVSFLLLTWDAAWAHEFKCSAFGGEFPPHASARDIGERALLSVRSHHKVVTEEPTYARARNPFVRIDRPPV